MEEEEGGGVGSGVISSFFLFLYCLFFVSGLVLVSPSVEEKELFKQNKGYKSVKKTHLHHKSEMWECIRWGCQGAFLPLSSFLLHFLRYREREKTSP